MGSTTENRKAVTPLEKRRDLQSVEVRHCGGTYPLLELFIEFIDFAGYRLSPKLMDEFWGNGVGMGRVREGIPKRNRVMKILARSHRVGEARLRDEGGDLCIPIILFFRAERLGGQDGGMRRPTPDESVKIRGVLIKPMNINEMILVGRVVLAINQDLPTKQTLRSFLSIVMISGPKESPTPMAILGRDVPNSKFLLLLLLFIVLSSSLRHDEN